MEPGQGSARGPVAGMVMPSSPGYRNGPGRASFDAFHAAGTEIKPECGDAPPLRVMGIFFDGAEGLVQQEDRGLALAQAGAAFPGIDADAIAAFFVIYGDLRLSLYGFLHVTHLSAAFLSFFHTCPHRGGALSLSKGAGA